jgi:hypothetical protein
VGRLRRARWRVAPRERARAARRGGAVRAPALQVPDGHVAGAEGEEEPVLVEVDERRRRREGLRADAEPRAGARVHD